MSLSFERFDLGPSATLIAIRGRMLLCPEFRDLESLVEGLADTHGARVIVDLSAVQQIDSTGMGMFISAHGKLERSGGELRLAGAHGAVRDAFRITRLDTIFTFYSTADAARTGL